MLVTDDTLMTNNQEKRIHPQIYENLNIQPNITSFQSKQQKLFNNPAQKKVSTHIRMYASSLANILESLEVFEHSLVLKKSSLQVHYHTFNKLYLLVKEIKMLLSMGDAIPLVDTSQATYDLFLNLSYLQDSFPSLLAQIKTLDLLPSTKHGHSRKNKEIAYRLQEIIHVSHQIQFALTVLDNEHTLLLGKTEL